MQNYPDIKVCVTCGAAVMIKCFPIHERACIQKKNKVNRISEKNVEDLIPCTQCGQNVSFSIYSQHIEECVGRQLTKCPNCKLLYPTFLFEEHIAVCTTFREEEVQPLNFVAFQFQDQQEAQAQDPQMTAMIMELAKKGNISSEPLPLDIINKIKKVDISNSEECSICYCTISKNSQIMKLNCPHHYHVRCISAWLQKNPLCPMCRRHCLT